MTTIQPLWQTLWQAICDAAAGLSMKEWAGIGFGLFLLVDAIILWRILTRRKRPPPPAAPDLTIALETLGEDGPPQSGPTLEFYNLPVRLAAVIIAPAGRIGQLPPQEQLPELFEAILPGLERVVQSQQPLLCRWPSQLSSRGFAHTLFAHVRLPGDNGKGTPWSSVAGVCKLHNQSVMAGLVLRAQSPNSLGQIVIEHETQWLGCLRVKA